MNFGASLAVGIGYAIAFVVIASILISFLPPDVQGRIVGWLDHTMRKLEEEEMERKSKELEDIERESRK